jgi:hypothetical protein
MSSSDKTKLDGLSISGTTDYLSKFTSSSSIGNSVVVEQNSNAIGVSTAFLGAAFASAAGFKNLAIGTSYFDGTNYITPAPGSNAIAEIVADSSGVGFIVLSSVGSATRTDSPAAFLALERFRVSSAGAAVAGALSVVGAYLSGDDTIPALGAGRSVKFTVLNGGGVGAYGLLGGVIGTGSAFLQVQRVDGTATAYDMYLQPNGGFVGVGTITPQARLHVSGPVALDCANLQAVLGVDKEILQAYDAVGSQLVSRHGGGFGDEAVTHANLAGSSSKSPKHQKFCSQYSVTAPANFTQTISLSIFGSAMPANRSFVATLTLTQRVDSASTTGVAVITLIAGTTSGSGALDAVYITTTPMVAGPGGTGLSITVNVVSGTQFSFTVNNAYFAGAITGYWEIELAWVGT